MTGSQEVTGSTPVFSTLIIKELQRFAVVAPFLFEANYLNFLPAITPKIKGNKIIRANLASPVMPSNSSEISMFTNINQRDKPTIISRLMWIEIT